MTKTPEEQAEQIADAFGMFDDWEERYRFLIDLGRKLPPLDEAAKIEENRITGCQSKVWVIAHPEPKPDGTVIAFDADSDSAIVKGLIAILRRVYNEQPAGEILRFDVEGLLDRLDLNQHLSMNRRNGLAGMIQRIRGLARSLDSPTSAPSNV